MLSLYFQIPETYILHVCLCHIFMKHFWPFIHDIYFTLVFIQHRQKEDDNQLETSDCIYEKVAYFHALIRLYHKFSKILQYPVTIKHYTCYIFVFQLRIIIYEYGYIKSLQMKKKICLFSIYFRIDTTLIVPLHHHLTRIPRDLLGLC